MNFVRLLLLDLPLRTIYLNICVIVNFQQTILGVRFSAAGWDLGGSG